MRQSVKDKMEAIEFERVKEVFDKLKQTEDQVMKTKKKQQWEVLIKQEQQNLKRQEREDEVRRVQKMREYQREQTLLKMKEDDQKTAKVFQEKAKLMEARAKMKKEIERKKEIIMRKLDKYKKHKVRSKQHSINSEDDLKSILSVSERSKSESVTPRLISSFKKKPRQKKLKSSEGYVEELTRPSVNSTNSQNKEQILELMKHNHATKMRKKLEEEQRKEDERNVILSSIKDQKERNRLEKIFGLERAKASQKLNDFVQKLEDDMENTKKKYWLL